MFTIRHTLHICLFGVLFLLTYQVHAQLDSAAILTPELVDKSNIAPRDIRLKKTQAYTATRRTEDIATSPFTTYVVSSDDILRNNFLTLGDLLRTLPGFIVSKSGSALEGEKFMLLGAPGNSQVKVLINNMPVKPYAAKGMPIGAQLPLRQAERVEVVYGPSPVLYGGEACAAVINIILMETERPIFALADLGFGTLGFNSLDISFGGKLGRDKNIFRFSMYGSSTVQQNRDIFWNAEETYNVERYYTFDHDVHPFLVQNGNFRAENFLDSVPILGVAPHESRLFGLNFIWRGIRFSYHRMGRSELSAIGKNTYAVSYANPGDLISERIETYSMSFNRKRKRRQTAMLFSVQNYGFEESSSTSYVFDGLGSALFALEQTGDPQTDNALQKTITEDLFSNQRIATAGSWDFRTDYQIDFQPKRISNLSWGLNWLNWVGFGYGYHGYLERPYTGTVLLTEPRELTLPYNPQLDPLAETNLGMHANWNSKKLNIHASGGGVLAPGYNGFYPRLGAYYQLKKFLGLKANYSKGYQRIAAHTRANTYRLQSGLKGVVPASFLFLQEGLLTQNEAETYQSVEVGLRAKVQNISLDANIFDTRREGFAMNGLMYDWQGFDTSYYVYGYGLHPDAATSVRGLMATFSIDSLDLVFLRPKKERQFWWSNKVHLVASRIRATLPYTGGSFEFPISTIQQTEIPNYPSFIIQWQSTLSTKNADFSVRFFRQSLTSNHGALHRPLFRQNTTQLVNAGFSTWDVTSRIFLNKNLYVYFNCSNIFNRQYYGIDATGSPDDLQGNPQPGRMIRFGINYNLN